MENNREIKELWAFLWHFKFNYYLCTRNHSMSEAFGGVLNRT